MATFNVSGPGALTGNTQADIEMICEVVGNLVNQLNYVLNSLDDENLSDDILSRIYEREE